MLLREHARGGSYDVDKVLEWVLDRQMRLEGGYQGLKSTRVRKRCSIRADGDLVCVLLA